MIFGMPRAVTAEGVRRNLHAYGLARDQLLIALARRARLSHIDLHALEHLEEAGPLTPRDLEVRLGLTSGAVTALIDRLERAGWTTRTPNPADRRSVFVDLSDGAYDISGVSLAAFHAELAAITNRLAPGDRAVIASFLARVTAAARTAGVALRDER